MPRWYRRTSRARLVAEGQRETRPARFPHAPSHRRPPPERSESAGYSTAVELPVAFDGRPGLPDTLGRALRDLRISVTDRCNFRCTYCMPKEVFGKDYAFLPKDQVLTFEEIERLARAFVALGVEKLRITGGEPLVRRDLPTLIAELAAIRRPDGGEVDLTLTTNGSALRALARPLADAGLKRVTVSLDSLDDATFGAMNGIDFPVERVLDGIAAAHRGRPDAGQDQHGRPARRQRVEHRADGRVGARHRRHPALHRVHGRRPLERLAARRGRPGPGAHRSARRRVAGRAGRSALSRRGRRSLALPRRTRRVRGHLVGDPAVLSRLHPGAPVGRGQAVHVPLRRPGERRPGGAPRAVRRTTS